MERIARPSQNNTIMTKFISFSGGVESTAMCLLYGKGAKAIWCDTGAEHQLMYDRIDYCEAKLKEFHKGNFELIRIKPSVTCKGEKVQTLTQYIERAMFMPSQMRRYCTGRFKIEPIDLFLSQQGQCELLIGFNADETARVGNLEKAKNVAYSYPLQSDGYSREDCEFMLSQHDLHPNLPPYMKRGGCKYCIFKSIREYKAMYFFNRNEFLECLNLENSVQDKRGKFFAISMTGRALQSVADECENELQMFSLEQIKSMYINIQPAQACGAFCHR